MLEHFRQKRIVKWLKQMGFTVIRLRSTSEDSWPDLMALKKPGITWFIEVKRDGQEPSEKQEKKIKHLKELGFKVEVMYDKPQETKADKKRNGATKPRAYIDLTE